MKAKTPAAAVSLLILGVFYLSTPALAQSPGGGGVPMAVTIKGSTTAAFGGDGGYPVEKFSVSTGSWGLCDLVVLFFGEGSCPRGAKLVFDSGDLMLMDRYGELIDDLTSDGFMSLQLDVTGGGGAWSGQINYDTGAAKFTGTYMSAVTIDDGTGSSVRTETGIAKETYSISAPDRSGNQRVSDSITMNLSGDGSIYGLYDVGTMTLTLKGSGILFGGELVRVDPTSENTETSAP